MQYMTETQKLCDQFSK